jgi:quinoprotein glucose dehydrogenase
MMWRTHSCVPHRHSCRCPALAIILISAPLALAQSPEWPAYGHDPGGARYSPLKQIDTTNVSRLQRVWTYHTGDAGNFETTPIIVDHVLYFSTPRQRVIALDSETGREIWTFDARARTREHRGVAYWRGDAQTAPRIFFGTSDGRLMALDAKTGRTASGFGDNGTIDLRAGVAEGYGDAQYGITSPPAIWRNLIIVGPSTQETVSRGPSGDARAFDARTGKLVWRFHTVPQPGEPGSDTWGPNGWKDRAGPSLWGPITVDAERGMVFLPVGNPADSFYGADRKGTNLYANSVVALNATDGKLLWYYQMVHHDLFDYDVDAPPALIQAAGKPAVAETTKMGLLFILDRLTGKPIFGSEERPAPASDVPGESAWPTQPFPLKPPPLARMTVNAAEVRPSCAGQLKQLIHNGPYTPFGMKIALRFPGTMGGGNWGGVSFDPSLGYIFANTSNLGGTGGMAAAPEGAPMPYRPVGGYTRWVDKDGYPCQQPPWGELTAVNAATGDIAWRVPLGSYEGLPNSGTPNLGGSIATAGGLVFIGATLDGRFRAFDSRTGRELWNTKLDAAADTIPATYLGRDGRQYVVIAAGGPGRFRSIDASKGPDADSLIAFVLSPSWHSQKSNTTASLRGLAVLSRTTAWASGTGGTYLRTTDGATWTAATVPGAESLDFRDVHAVDARTAWLLATGPGNKSRIYKTADAGGHWTLQLTNPDAAGFLDAVAFWEADHGIALGDPVDGRFVIFVTDDGGAHWREQPGPQALPKEGAFAASGTCLIVTDAHDAWFGTGGARIFHSTDRGRTWTVAATPIRHDGPGAGIFSLAFSDALHGIAVGGDYTKPDSAEHNIAVTSDGGRTWTEPAGPYPAGYRSAVAYDRARKAWIATGTSGSDISSDNGQSWARFDTAGYNAAAFAPDGTGWAVGLKGALAAFTLL